MRKENERFVFYYRDLLRKNPYNSIVNLTIAIPLIETVAGISEYMSGLGPSALHTSLYLILGTTLWSENIEQVMKQSYRNFK